MLRHQKFKFLLVLEVALIILFKTQNVGAEFYKNVFYIAPMVLGVYLYGMVFGYHCPNCKKNQIMKSMYKYALPKLHCWNCGEDLERNNKNGT
jgi:hypothetical protein